MEILRKGSKGVYVELLQSILLQLKFYNGKIDGIFGKNTENGVKQFQINSRLKSDGIVGEKTWEKLMPYINGYFNYTIKKGDTLYYIANKFSTSMRRILYANPKLNPNNLLIGENVIVPIANIVRTNMSYFSELLEYNINSLKKLYPFLEFGDIGKSVMGKDLFYAKIGKGDKKVFYSGGIHSNEWITSTLLMKFIENFSKIYIKNGKMFGYNVREVFNKVSIYIVPMVNPDAIDLVVGALNKDNKKYIEAKNMSTFYPQIPFPNGWKSNINGVNLNLQFPAGWEIAKQIKYAQGYTRPGPKDFVGYSPLSEPEALAMYNFSLQNKFDLILAYHTQGEVIYWKFLDYNPPRAKIIGERLSKITGYPLENTPYSSGYAGYKDWFIETYNKAGYTIEVGKGINPISISQFNKIYKENEGALIYSAIVV